MLAHLPLNLKKILCAYQNMIEAIIYHLRSKINRDFLKYVHFKKRLKYLIEKLR